MCRKTTLVRLVLFGYLVSGMAGECFCDVSAGVKQAESDIISLIKKSDYAQAKVQTKRFVAGRPASPALSNTLHSIARQYEWSDKYEEAKSVYQEMIKNSSDSSDTKRARLGVSRTDVLALILSGKHRAAEKKFRRLLAGFSGHPELPDTLYWIAERYRWAGKNKEAKRIYKQIMRNHKDSPYASKAELGTLRTDITSHIRSKDDYLIKESVYEIDEMVSRFSDHPDLPALLYWFGRSYEWEREYEKANNLYQQIIADYFDSQYADRSRISIARANIMHLIVSHKFDEAKDAFDKLSTDFIINPDMSAAMYWIAEEYKWAGEYGEAKKIHQQLIRRYPGTSYAEKARLAIARAEALALIKSEKFEQAKEAAGEIAAEFPKDADLPETLYWIAERHRWLKRYEDANSIYRQIIQNHSDSPYAEKAQLGTVMMEITSLMESEDYNKADAAAEKMIADYYNSNQTAENLFGVARRYRDLGKYKKALYYFQKIMDDWPDYKYAGKTQFIIGECYEKLRDSDVMPESEANPKIEAAYTAVVENYPGCGWDKDSLLRLGWINFKKGQLAGAARCWELFLEDYPQDTERHTILYPLGRAYEELGQPDKAKKAYKEFIKAVSSHDPRIKRVKARLRKLTKNN